MAFYFNYYYSFYFFSHSIVCIPIIWIACFSPFRWVVFDCCRAFIFCLFAMKKKKKQSTVRECVVCCWALHKNEKCAKIPKNVTVLPISMLIPICSAVLPPSDNKTELMNNNRKKQQPEERSTDSECDMVGLGCVECYRVMFCVRFFQSVKWYLCSVALNVASDFMVLYTHTHPYSVFHRSLCKRALIRSLILYRLIRVLVNLILNGILSIQFDVCINHWRLETYNYHPSAFPPLPQTLSFGIQASRQLEIGSFLTFGNFSIADRNWLGQIFHSHRVNNE